MTLVDVLWSLFHLLTGTSVRMEHGTASSASSDAVEIRMQRHCEMMQDVVAELLSFLLSVCVRKRLCVKAFVCESVCASVKRHLHVKAYVCKRVCV